MTIHKRVLAAAVAVTIGAGAAVPAITGARPATGKTQILRFFDKPVNILLTTSGGKVISHPPYPQPQAGDILNVYSLDYPGNHSHHASHWTMSTHLSCTFAQGPPACISNVALGSSLLVFDGNKLVGATGAYQGATGQGPEQQVALGGKLLGHRRTGHAPLMEARLRLGSPVPSTPATQVAARVRDCFPTRAMTARQCLSAMAFPIAGAPPRVR